MSFHENLRSSVCDLLKQINLLLARKGLNAQLLYMRSNGLGYGSSLCGWDQLDLWLLYYPVLSKMRLSIQILIIMIEASISASEKLLPYTNLIQVAFLYVVDTQDESSCLNHIIIK